MIKSFTIQNFKSILDLTIDFTYDEGKAPNGYKEMETLPFLEVKKNKKNPIRLVPCMALFGANAAGKSSIIEALYAMQNLINCRIEGKYQPNKLNKKYNATTFIIEVVIEKNIYKYELQYNDDEILKEILIVDNKKIYSINKGALKVNSITTTIYNTKKLQEIYKVECCDGKVQHRTFLNIISKNYAGLNKFITSFNKYINNRIYILDNIEFPLDVSLNLLEKECGIDKQKAFEEIVHILRKLDFDITRMIYRGIEKRIFSYHKDINDKEVEFDFRKEESLGTNTLLDIFGPILLALYTGAIVCIDELERSIHPLLLRKIIKLFKSKRYNTNNAQLVFTAHNTDILDDQILRVSEIAFTSKDIADGTTINRASSFEGVRNVDNFRKGYLYGEFSAIPYPYNITLMHR